MCIFCIQLLFTKYGDSVFALMLFVFVCGLFFFFFIPVTSLFIATSAFVHLVLLDCLSWYVILTCIPLCFLHIEKIQFTEAVSRYTYSGQTVLNLNCKISKEILFFIVEVVQVNKLRRIGSCCRITFKNL